MARETEAMQAKLDDLNRELDLLLYVVSHDLRAPLRSLDGFSMALVEDYGDELDDMGRDFVSRIRGATKRLEVLMEGFLSISRQSRGEVEPEDLDLSLMAAEAAGKAGERHPAGRAKLHIQDGLRAFADRRLAFVLLEKLFDNAFKFSAPVEEPVVEFGRSEEGEKGFFFVRDNGVGFSMEYARDRLFGPLQRMHEEGQFEGLGVGLATARRIVARHGGTISAVSEPGKGCEIRFVLPGQGEQ